MHAALIIAILASETLRPGVAVRDEGAAKGQAQVVNCTGTGVTCSVGAGGVWTLNAASGGGGLPADPAACPANQYVTDQNQTGVLVCAQVGYSQLTGAPTIPTDISGAPFVTTAASGLLSAESVLPTCAGTTKLTFNGSAISCGTDQDTVYTLPDAAAGTTGGVRLTGDLGGTATSPSVVDDSHAHTTTTVSGLDAGADFSAGTLPQGRGGMGVASLTCSGTDKVTCNGTTCSCATDQTSAGGGYATVQDEGGALTARTTLNFAGAGVSCADDTTRTTCTIAGGGGGSPGGSTTQVQYNNSGAFGGMSRVTTDGADLILTGSTTEPSAPAAGFTKLYGAQPHGSNGPVLPFWKGGATQVDYRLFPEMRSADPVWGCLQPGAHGSTTITPAGSMVAGGATGTPAAVAWAATDERTRAKWVQYPTTAAINLNAGLRAGVDYMWRGNAAGIGGFYTWGTVNIVTANAGQRFFAGLKDATAVLTATADPSAALDTVYFGCNAADTTLRICSNDNSGAATCTDLGANFPCKTANTAYDWALWAQPNGSSIGYYIRRLVNGSEAQGTLSTDLPRNTVALGWDMTINSGSTAAITTMQFGGVCYIANP